MPRMKIKIALIVSLVISGCSSLPDDTYLKVGAGYKVHETVEYYYHGNKVSHSKPVTARIEVGSVCGENLTCGVSHHSQWFTGFPFNNDREYSKTEIFFDYTWELK